MVETRAASELPAAAPCRQLPHLPRLRPAFPTPPTIKSSASCPPCPSLLHPQVCRPRWPAAPRRPWASSGAGARPRPSQPPPPPSARRRRHCSSQGLRPRGRVSRRRRRGGGPQAPLRATSHARPRRCSRRAGPLPRSSTPTSARSSELGRCRDAVARLESENARLRAERRAAEVEEGRGDDR
ncbi:hypothetical protein BS78_03G030800 [Paspalum vaginatum]|nr:hypothetical protein BS78_03G030800 [Paspalum vaginatum]